MKTRITDKLAARTTVSLADTLDRFGLRVQGTKKSWTLRYKDATGRSIRYTIGSFPEMSTERAREIAIEKLPNIKHGIAPHQERVVKAKAEATEQELQANTLANVIEEFLAYQAGELRPKSLEEATRYLRKTWKHLHRTPIDEITLRMVASHLDAIARDGSKSKANKARAALSGMFAWAMTRGKATSNPVALFPKFDEQSRDRVLSMDELAAIWKACKDDDYGRIIRLLILTGQRRGEVGGLRWSEIDLDKALWTLPGERAKNGCSNAVPLAPAALELLPARMERETLFGSGKSEKGFRNFPEQKEALDDRSGVVDWVVHDIRRSVATGMANLGVQPHVIEVILNHRSAAQVGEVALPGHRSTVAGIYNRAAYEAEVRQAILLWAERVTGSNVVVPLPLAA